jgi:hypothetical protein
MFNIAEVISFSVSQNSNKMATEHAFAVRRTNETIRERRQHQSKRKTTPIWTAEISTTLPELTKTQSSLIRKPSLLLGPKSSKYSLADTSDGLRSPISPLSPCSPHTPLTPLAPLTPVTPGASPQTASSLKICSPEPPKLPPLSFMVVPTENRDFERKMLPSKSRVPC